MMICYVCADFYDKNKKLIYRIAPSDIRTILADPPEEVWEDPLFKMLVGDGSIAFAKDDKELQMLEKEPMLGIDAAGRKKGTNKGDYDVEPEVMAKKYEPTPKASKPKTEGKAGTKAEAKVGTKTDAKVETKTDPASGPVGTEQPRS